MSGSLQSASWAGFGAAAEAGEGFFGGLADGISEPQDAWSFQMRRQDRWLRTIEDQNRELIDRQERLLQQNRKLQERLDRLRRR